MKALCFIALATISLISCYVLPSGGVILPTSTPTATMTPTPPPPTPATAAPDDTSAGGSLDDEKPTPDAPPYAPPPQFNPTPETLIPIGGY